MAIGDIRNDLTAAVSGGSSTASEAGLASLLGRIAQSPDGAGGDRAGGTSNLGTELAALTSEVAGLRAASEQHAASVQENTLATAENTAASIGGVARALGKAVSETAGSGIAGVGLPALIAGLVGALAGNSSPDAVTLPVLTQPASIQVEAALPSVEQPNFTPVATGQGGLSRRATTETTSPAAVTIQVNAMDSRSFLDHSDEIARAVRHALLNTHSLRDVVGEL